jgi:hypothetical protein
MMRVGGRAGLEASVAVLLVDVSESGALLAVLEEAGDGHDQGHVDTDHTENGSEDVVNKNVSERGQRSGAALEQRCRGRTRAGGIRDEGWGGAVKVATALELF